MTTFPIDLPESFEFLTARQDVVSENMVEAEDARGQILVQDHGAPQWQGNFNLRPMAPNEAMYNDWRTFVSQIQQSFGTFRMPPVDIFTGQRYKSQPCECMVLATTTGRNMISTTPINFRERGRPIGARWWTHEDNLYEVIVDIDNPHRANERLLTINPPLITDVLVQRITISEAEAYCIARATTITHPTITTNGLYQGAGIFWEQDIQI